MQKKRFMAVGIAIMAAMLMIGSFITWADEGGITTQTSHMSGPLDITLPGSESAPAFYLAGDSDTGIYQSAADNFDFTVAGSNVLNLSSGGLGISGGITLTLDATGKVLVDGHTTRQTQPEGAVDIDVETITANVSGLTVFVTTEDGAAAGADVFGGIITISQNDANADMFGLKIVALETANATTNSYEYGLLYDCAEGSVGTCIDGILLTSTGVSGGMVDGLDASAANIVNAVNIGSNPVLGNNADTFTLGVTDHHFILIGDEAAAVTFMGADDSSPADTVFDTTGAGSVTVGSGDVTEVILRADHDVQIIAGESGDVSLDLRDYADTAVDDMAHAAFTANCSNTGDGTEECDLSIATVRAGVASTAINIDADEEMTLLSENQFELVNAASGNVELIFQDYADTDSDDLDHVVLTANCTDVSATEDCDFTIGVIENAGAVETRFHIDADLGITIGSANTNLVTLQTQGTADGADLVLPAQGVNAGEILNDTITFAQISDSSDIDADTKFLLADAIELELEALHTTGDTSVLLLDVAQVDNEAADDDMYAFKIDATSESNDVNDTFWGIGIVWEDGSAHTIMDAAIDINNEETTAGTMTDGVRVRSTGVNLGVTDAFDASDGNIVNALNIGTNYIMGGDELLTIGDTDDAVVLKRSEAGAATYTCEDDNTDATCIFDSGGSGDAQLGTADTTAAMLVGLSAGFEIGGANVITVTTTAMSLTIPIWTTSYVSVEDNSYFSGDLSNLAGNFTIDDNLDVTGDLDVDGTTNLDVVDIDGAVQMDAAFTFGTSATGHSFVWHSDTGGEEMTWDDVNSKLVIDGIDGQNAFEVTDGNVAFTDELDVSGTTNLDVVDVDGAVDMASTLDVVTYIQTTGYVSVEDDSYFYGDLSDLGGNFTIADDLDVTGALDVQGGDITMENDETWSNATDTVVATDGMLGFLQWIEDTVASMTLTPAESGKLIVNDGVSDMIYVTLPDSAAGLFFGMMAEDDHDIRVEPSVTEQILGCTNAVGDACVVDNQYEAIWLVGTGDAWLVVYQIGTPTDGD